MSQTGWNERDATWPAQHARAITPSDTDDLPFVTRAIYVGDDGDIRLIAAGDSQAVTLPAVPAGRVIPISAKRVLATGTTSGSLIALY